VQQVARIGVALATGLRVDELSPPQARDEMARSLRPQVVDTMRRMWAALNGAPATISDRVESIMGRSARTFATWARDHAADFR